MSATYNWAYKPGVPNKYGFVVNASDDDVEPSNACYVSLFGNDNTGNGSRMLPYRTITKGASTGLVVIVGSGTYRNETNPNCMVYGDGDVIIDAFLYGGLPYGCQNVRCINVQAGGRMDRQRDVQILGDGFAAMDCYQNEAINNHNILQNLGHIDYRHAGPIVNGVGNNTFVDIKNLSISVEANGSGVASYGQLWFAIFDGCNITFDGIGCNVDYVLFNNCSFRVGSGAFTPINDISTLQAMVQAFSPGNNSFSKSIFADPKFNNRAIGDFTLAFDSPAKNLKQDGTYVGARSIAYKVNAVAGTGGAFDLTTADNVTVGDDSIEFTDDTADAQIDTNVIPNIVKRELSRIPSYGVNADRNGQYIDSIPDLSATSISPGTALTVGLPYLVENGAVEYNGAALADGDRFTVVAATTAFTSSAGGTVREIVEAPQRHTVMMRVSDGTIQAGSLTLGYWYYANGAVTHDGNTYTNVTFKATANSGFTGAVEFVFDNSDSGWQHYEPGIKPTSNNVGDARLGDIVRGNGDPTYERGGVGVNEFPINAKYIQIRYFLRHANLKP